MLRNLFAAFLFVLLAGAGVAHATTISASGVADSFTPPLASAKLCFAPVDATGTATGFRVGSIQVVSTPVCGLVSNGVLQSGLSVVATPTGIFYRISAQNRTTSVIIRDYGMTPITGSAWTLDSYDPSTAVLPVSTITMGTVTTLAPGTGASCGIGGTSPTYLLNCSIPQGATGATGSGTLDSVARSAAAAAQTMANAAVPSAGGTMSGQLNVPTPYTATTGQYQLSATRGLAGYVTPELFGAYGDGTHDDTAAIQACWHASSTSSLMCRMSPTPSGAACGLYPFVGCYRVNGQLIIEFGMHVSGNSQNGTIIKSEYNGPAVGMTVGPVNNVVMENIGLMLDPTLPNSAGFYFVAVPAGSPPSGGLWYSEFRNIEINNPAKECIRLDGGGAPGYTFNFPNQALQFNAVNCNGPAGQSHPAPLLEISGQMGQVIFQGGVINGDPTSTGTGTSRVYTYYPNAIVLIQEAGGTYGNLAAGNIDFSEESIQYGAVGFDLHFATNIVITDASHFESLGNLVTAHASQFIVSNTYSGDVGTSTGGVLNLGNGNIVAMTDNLFINDSSNLIAAMATCTGSNTVRFENNATPNQTPATVNCATNITGISSSTLTFVASTDLVNGDGGATPVSTLSGPIDPGKTVSLIAWGNSFKLTTGGNIQFGGFTAPLNIPQNTSVTLRLYDLGPTYMVESVNGVGGYTGTVTCTSGQHVNSITISNGVITTAPTCN